MLFYRKPYYDNFFHLSFILSINNTIKTMNLLVVSLDPKGVSTYRLLEKILKDYYCIACPTTDKPVRIFFPYSYVARKSYKKIPELLLWNLSFHSQTKCIFHLLEFLIFLRIFYLFLILPGILLNFYRQQKKHGINTVLFGAANQIRTGDLVLTKDVLCLLSHSSIRKRQDKLAFCGDPERARTVDL